MSYESNESFLFIQQFSNKIKQADNKSECIERLIQCVPDLLSAYPDPNEAMIEAVCNAIIQGALVGSVCSVVIDSDGLELVLPFISTLHGVEWITAKSTSLISLACEAVSRVLVLFKLKTSACLQLIASFLRVLFDKLSGDSLFAVGGSFPCDLPDTMYVSFEGLGIFSKMESLVSMYTEMKEHDFANILKVLCSFLQVLPSCATVLISDSTHFMLLFASQHFPSAYEVQDALWSLLTCLLMSGARDVATDLNPQVLLPAVSSFVMSTECSVRPVVNFLCEYIPITNTIKPPLVLQCFEEHPELIIALLHKLDPSRTLETETQNEEVGAIAELLENFFFKFRQCSTYKYIIQYHLLEALLKASVKWPELCCLSYCTAIKHLLGHFPPDDIAKQHPGLMHVLKQPLQDKKDFCEENRIIPFIDLFNSPDTFKSQEMRASIYDTMRQLLIVAPDDETRNKWVTDEVLKCVISCLPKDVRTFPSKTHNFVFFSHFLVFIIKKERMEIIRDQKWHEVAVNDCLKLADTDKSLNCCLGFTACILQAYTQAFKDVSLFAESDFPQVMVDIAHKHGLGSDSSIGDIFGSLLLTLTADKQAPLILYNKKYLDQLYPLVDDKYDPLVVRPAIHAVGNIALSGHHIKQEILDKDFHSTLINYLNSKMATADPYILSACCRVLHILASGDYAKRQFAERGLVGILLRMLETREDNAEVCWRPLGLLSSLGFMSLSNREYIITDKVLRVVVNLLKTSKHSKVKSYTALVFLASIDSDRKSADLQRMRVTEIFQQILEETEGKDSSNDDLKKWGSSLLEKGQLFTIPLANSQLSQDEQQLLASCMEQSITWPERPPPTGLPEQESVDGQEVSLLPANESNLTPRFPTAPELSADAISQITKLGIDLKQIFRVGRFFGSSHGQCSNCDMEGRSEELVFRPESLTPHQYQELIMRGWYRRGGVKLYRYRYNHDLDCSDWETRVNIAEFDYKRHKSYKKVLKRMPEDRLTIETVPTQFIQEAYDLYNSYHLAKHDKPLKSHFSYCEHIVNGPLRNQSIDGFHYGSFHQLYYLDGKLVAVGVIDVVPNGIVSVYMWYSMCKEISKYSFGVYSALKEIEYARELSKCNPNIKYYYMQGWNENNHKLSYKARYEPEEFYSPCTVTEWVMSLDGVKKEQEIAKEKWLSENHHVIDSQTNTSEVKEEKIEKVHVPGDALSLDRLAYHAHHGPNEPDIMNIVICLNHQIYMYLGQMLDTYSIGSSQRQLMIDRLKELYYAIGDHLGKNMIVDIMACPSTGSLNGSSSIV